MRSALRQFVALIGSIGVLSSCEWAPPLAPDGPGSFRAASVGNTVAAPSNVTATASSHSVITVVWGDNSSNETGFEVHQGSNGATGTFFHIATTTASVTSTTSGGLVASTEYCFKVRAFMIKGRKTTYSAFSEAGCATTLPLPVPGAPTEVAAKPYSSTATVVTWIPAPGGQDGFRIERGPAPGGPWTTVWTTSGTGRSFYDGYLISEQMVCYRVFAYNGYGDSPPTADCTAPPARPTNLIATMDGADANLTWTDNSNVESGYEVRRANSDGSVSVVATLPADAIGYRDPGLASDSRFTYAVAALRDGGHSTWSDEASVTTPVTVAPGAPAVGASPATSTSVNVSWSATSVNTQSYRIERSTDGQASWVIIGNQTLDNTWFSEGGLSSEQSVCYRVFAINTAGESSSAACTTPPAAPTGLIQVALADQTVEVRWNDNSSAEDGFELWLYYYDYYCGYNEWGEWICDYVPYYYPYWLPPNTTSHVIGNWEYLYGIVATRDGGYSDWAFETGTSAAASRVNAQGPVRRPLLRPGVTASREKPDKVRSATTRPKR